MWVKRVNGDGDSSLLDGLGLEVPATDEIFAETMGGPDAVFVEAVALPGATVEAVGVVAVEVQIWNTILSFDCCASEEWMLVFEFVMDFFRSDFARRIDGNEVVFVFRDSLEAVHPIMRGVFSGRLDTVIPRCPSALGLGHETGIGMDDSSVGLIIKMTEDIAFEWGGRF